MGAARIACWAFVAAVALLTGAAASARASDRIVVLDRDGHTSAHVSRGSGAAEALPARAHATKARKHRRTTIGELKRLRDRGAITPEDYAARRAAYEDAKRVATRLKGTRAIELRAVIATIDDIAARRKLTPTRIPPLWLTLQRNLQWWTTGPLLPNGERVGFEGSELVWQYYRGQGLQIQWLGTFGKLNALAKSTRRSTLAPASRLTDEILSLATERAGGLAWEYLFSFGGGRAPWVSSLAQGTGLQALARAALRLGRQAEVFPITARALTIFQRPTPEGVRVAPQEGWAGPHFAQYSFAPGLYILNGFVQSVVGLHDYAEITGDATAQQLYLEGEREAAREVPLYDTGAWSLYSRGTSEHESDLSYHRLLVDFLASMCTRTGAPVYCDTAAKFTAYESQPPALQLARQRLRGGRGGTLRVRLSKISSVTVTIRRGDRTVFSRALGTVGHGLVRVSWAVPRKAGTYDVTVGARDLVGNPGSAAGSVEVLKPLKKRRRG